MWPVLRWLWRIYTHISTCKTMAWADNSRKCTYMMKTFKKENPLSIFTLKKEKNLSTKLIKQTISLKTIFEKPFLYSRTDSEEPFCCFNIIEFGIFYQYLLPIPLIPISNFFILPNSAVKFYQFKLIKVNHLSSFFWYEENIQVVRNN